MTHARRIKVSPHTIRILFVPLFLFLVFLSICFGFFFFYSGRIYPNVFVSSVNVGSLTIPTASSALSTSLSQASTLSITVTGKEPTTFSLPLSLISLRYAADASSYSAYMVGRDQSLFKNISTVLTLFFTPRILPYSYTFDESALDSFLSDIAGNVSTDAVSPSVRLDHGTVSVTRGSLGTTINTGQLKLAILHAFSRGNFSSLSTPLLTEGTVLSDSEISLLESRAKLLEGKHLTLTLGDTSLDLPDTELVSFLTPNGFSTEAIASKISLLSTTYNQEPQEPVLTLTDATSGSLPRVSSFTPGHHGITIQEELLTKRLSDGLVSLLTSNTISPIEIPTTDTPPRLNISDVNSFGIRDLLGVGTSKFKGSIPSRVHNVSLASSRINGILIPPGETFSFNAALGDISKYTGYKEAYIIQDGKTVLGDGGGVCQVSTTLFRAVLQAGLPIVERRGHSYRVGYYEQDTPAGIDATVFSPTTDFKFLNDTGSYLLLQTLVDTKAMTAEFRLYGTSDGRKATITKPVIYDQTPPPEDLYIDDPTLHAGTIKQIDYKAWGAKSKFDYTVERNGEIIYQKTFLTVYKPWQAKFLRGTGV
jgi:vancomycin resistance protein YoaR